MSSIFIEFPILLALCQSKQSLVNNIQVLYREYYITNNVFQD